MPPLPILALAVASFGIGTTEFVIMGLLPEVAQSFGVTIPQAGYLVSGYAMGVVVGAPIVAIATAGLPRKTALLALMAVFLAGNLGCALAPSYGLLMAARILTAFAHGAFFGIGAVVARDLVPREKRTQAVSLMFAGLTLANVLGVPLGTALGQEAGWRSTFWAVVVIGLAAGLAIQLCVPDGLPGTRGRLVSEFRALGRWPVLRPMLISTLSSVSFFTVFTYVTPFLTGVTGFTPQGVTGVLFAAGTGLTVGNLLGGHLADRGPMATIIGSFLGIVAALLVLAAVAHHPVLTVAVVVLWSGLVFALVSPLQIWVVEAASDAPNLASTLNQGAFNLGNAAGAWIGGTALTLGAGYGQLPLIAAAVSLAGLGLVLTAVSRGRQGAAPASAPGA
ncbi:MULTISPECIES: MFS transporter [Methylobacterium]|uniref:Major facilitator superfamily MFS_1 n=1 Tax=Methylobacterium radiotolerans (strain ATCC 27329 / DSM 1819 / JCM 2831 / NBRC 15690 / NCIMB 10815 / 0-1) TaxID=426355 RepID=B1M668_METRJ|nr:MULTISPECIES: MFS transporter [Methylobacterium]MBY0255464.1 MFS transporter [Methylobacterium organophilum]ACB22103.1 major facilitator superfamily MFS_1 [Methylobacterium radiotolerans JCM 2831]KIU37376.1 arabinose transporter permease [Methylobacterium radiotolerans]RUP18419.1 MAG: MFS transporter [Methylobacterium sp.]GEM95764.1 MFS transporter [Methylobacterium radiotolerans]